MNMVFVAWRGGTAEDGVWGPVGRLQYDCGTYRFFYTKGATILEGFTPFQGMSDIKEIYESDELFPLFTSRILSPKRPEFEAYLTWMGFNPADPPDPLSIMSVTQGIRQTDAVEVFPCPSPGFDGCYHGKFFIHGIRHLPQAARDQINELKSGDKLFLMPDLCDHFDGLAGSNRRPQDLHRLPPALFGGGYKPTVKGLSRGLDRANSGSSQSRCAHAAKTVVPIKSTLAGNFHAVRRPRIRADSFGNELCYEMSRVPHYPLIVVEVDSGDVVTCDSLDAAAVEMEPIDIMNDEYRVFDSTGRELALEVIKTPVCNRFPFLGSVEKVQVHFDAEASTNKADQLRPYLLESLINAGQERLELEHLPIDRLIENLRQTISPRLPRT